MSKKCTGCHKLSSDWCYYWQGNSISVCFDCYKWLCNNRDRILEQNRCGLNELSEDMEFIIGGVSKSTLPRYPLSSLKSESPVFNNINVENSTIGFVNTGKITGNIDGPIVVNKNEMIELLIKTIKNFSDAVEKAQDVSEERQNEILELISVLREQISLPKEKRRLSTIRVSIKEIAEFARDINSIQALWSIVHALFNKFFGLS